MHPIKAISVKNTSALEKARPDAEMGFCPMRYIREMAYTPDWLKNVQIGQKGNPEVTIRLPVKDGLQGVDIVIESGGGNLGIEKGNPAAAHCARTTIYYFFKYSYFYYFFSLRFFRGYLLKYIYRTRT